MKYVLSAALALLASPSMATVIVANGPSVTPALFNPLDRTGGSFVASNQVSGSTSTFSAVLSTAVFRNADGFIDFYYQVQRTGGSEPIELLTGSSYNGFTTDVYRDATDSDGAGGVFVTPANPPASLGFTTTASRTAAVVTFNFGANYLENSDISAVYIVRTNARGFTAGNFSVIDGTTLTIAGFAPTAVPEPATWAMMLGGFGVLGAAARRSRRPARALA